MQAVRENVLPLLEEGGVDLVLSGHSHAYERSHLIDGHYGDSTTFSASAMELGGGTGDPDCDGAYRKDGGAHSGTAYAVVGNSSRLNSGTLGYPAIPVTLAALSSLMVTIEGDLLEASVLDDDGATRDHFAVVKKRAAFLADGFEGGSISAWSGGAPPAPVPGPRLG